MSLEIDVHVIVHPDLISDESLAELMAKLSDFSPILERVGGIFEEELADNFESQGYGTWAPISQVTRRDKERKGFGNEPDLVREGTLERALTMRDAPGHKFLVSPTELIVGVYDEVIPYAKWLANGTRNMPARILINITASGVDRTLNMIKEWLGVGDAADVYADATLFK